MEYIIVCVNGSGVEWAEGYTNIHFASSRILELLFNDERFAEGLGAREYLPCYLLYQKDKSHGRAFSVNGLCNYGGSVEEIESFLEEWGETRETVLRQLNK